MVDGIWQILMTRLINWRLKVIGWINIGLVSANRLLRRFQVKRLQQAWSCTRQAVWTVTPAPNLPLYPIRCRD